MTSKILNPAPDSMKRNSAAAAAMLRPCDCPIRIPPLGREQGKGKKQPQDQILLLLRKWKLAAGLVLVLVLGWCWCWAVLVLVPCWCSCWAVLVLGRAVPKQQKTSLKTTSSVILRGSVKLITTEMTPLSSGDVHN